ncbi:SRPBCC domain-containing protein, partial [candidate division CSSED10-310 bacterium]
GAVIIEAGLNNVWEAWTTKAGLESFFAPVCHIDLCVDGLYEILFNPDGEPGFRGAEGMRIMAFQSRKMLAFTWNAPPHLTSVRQQLTHVVIRFHELAADQTKVTLHHDGWGQGGEWDQAFDYFTSAWLEVVLPRLKQRFITGPIDWNTC